MVQACRQEQQSSIKSDVADSFRQIPLTIDSASSRELVNSYLKKARENKDSAKYFYEKAEPLIAFTDQESQLNFYTDIGDICLDRNEYVRADAYYEKGRIVLEGLKKTPRQLVLFYLTLARCKVQTMDFVTARSLAQYAQKLIEENNPGDPELIGRCQNTLGTIFFYQKDYPRAIENWELAILHWRKAGRPEKDGLDRLYINIAQSYKFSGQLESAWPYLNKAISISRKQYGPESQQVADKYLAKGAYFQASGNSDSAVFYFRRMIAMRYQMFGKKHLNTFGALYTYGEFFESNKSFDSAVFYYQKSMISLINGFEDPDWAANPKPSTQECNPNLFMALEAKGRALKLMADAKQNESALLRNSLSSFLLADSTLNIYRRNTVYDDSQQVLKDSFRIPFAAVMDITYSLYQSGKNEDYAILAQQVMEGSRAALLRDALQRTEASGKTGLPKELKQKENELIRRRAALLAAMGNSVVKSSSDSIAKELLTVNNEERDLLQNIGIINPNYLNVKYAGQETDVVRVKEELRNRGNVFMEYFWGDQFIYLSIVDKDGIELKRISRDSAFNKTFATFLSEIGKGQEQLIKKEHFQNYCQAAFTLYQKLVGDPLEKRTVNKAVISADGQLSSFPFDALITAMPDTTEVDYRLPYLVKSCAISYVFSYGFMDFYNKDRTRGDKLLAFAYGGKGTLPAERNDLQDLPGTSDEINAIRAVMPNSDNRYFLENDASESEFKKQISHFNVAHLAIHGMSDTINALQSRLIFRTKGDAKEDGQLYAYELYDLDLGQLDLAVLSACESGIGKRETGEGMMSMARGFTYAGCPSLVISLWKINDRMSALIMGRFYQYVSEGIELDVALAHAKNDYLTQSNEFNAHPRYWASFLQVGDSRSIRSESYWKLILGLAGSVFFVIFLWRRRVS